MAFDEEEQADVTQDNDDYDPFGEDSLTDEPLDDEPSADAPPPELTIVEADGEPDADERPVDELGLVQLAARLGASLEKRRAWLAERQSAAPLATPMPTPFADDEDFQAAGAEDAARAIADFFGPAGATESEEPAQAFIDEQPEPEPEPEPEAEEAAFQPMPASLRGVPVDHDDDIDEDAIGASLSLPLGSPHSPLGETADNQAEGFDEEEPDDGEYSSLLAMKNPFARQQEFVRIEEPEDDSGAIEPAVTFPSAAIAAPAIEHEAPMRASAARPFDPPKKAAEPVLRPAPAVAPRDPGDAERSLRDALATLQRMSGAA